MTLTKEDGILDLLSKLELDQRDWIVIDHWEADLCAVGIASRSDPRRLVYVSNYGNGPGLFDFECEAPDGPQEADYRTVDRGEKVVFEDLVIVLEKHLVPLES